MKKLIILALAFLFAKGLPKAKALTLALTFSLAFSLVSFAQNIAITDDNGYTADPSAMLDVKSTTKGMLVPRVTTIQRSAISNPANGLLVFDTDLQSFFFSDGTAWTNLSSGNPSGLWGQSGNKVFLNDTTYNLGIGTQTPEGKLEVKADATTGVTEAIFGVINNNGDTVFAVYPEGVRILVADDVNKAVGSKSGFAIGGFSLTKGATAEYMRVTPDSVRIYVEESPATPTGTTKGGFSVGGFNSVSGTLTNEYLRVTDDSVRVYIDKDGGSKAVASKGGFAIGGFSLTKSIADDYFNISGADSAEIISPSETRMVWYPTKNAFLAGQVIIEDDDSVGTNSMAVGYESKAIGEYSQALGFHARAFGDNSTAIGNYANAISNSSFAFGDYAIAKGIGSYAFASIGRDAFGNPMNVPSIAEGDYSFVFGNGDTATALGAFAIGSNNMSSGEIAMAIGSGNIAGGNNSIAIGKGNISNATSSMALGLTSNSTGIYSTALGISANATGPYSTAIGTDVEASGEHAISIGHSSHATQNWASAIGYNCNSSGMMAVSIGFGANSSGISSLALGSGSLSSGIGSTAMGYYTVASGNESTAIGYQTDATGSYSLSTGYRTEASGSYSVSFGREIEAAGAYSFAIALNDQNGAIVSQNNTMSIMGGRVGIGTVSPLYDLQVSATNATISVNSLEISDMGTNNLGLDGDIIPYAGSAANYDLGNNTATEHWDDVVANAFITFSDINAKKNISDIDLGLAELMQLHPVKYQYKKVIDKDEKVRYGLIAQEIELIIPNVVVNDDVDVDPETGETITTKSDYKAMNYIDLIPVMIKSIQEQQEIIEEQRIRIEKLEAGINNQ